MDDYPKDFIDGVTPLIFAVDTVFRKDGDSTNNPANANQKSTAFETFYNFIAAKKTKNSKMLSTPTEKDEGKPSDPLSGVFQSQSSEFFSHANVVPVSNRHAFPPSKDPHGNQNSVTKLNNALYAARKQKFVLSHKKYSSINGIAVPGAASSPITGTPTNEIGSNNHTPSLSQPMTTQIPPTTAILSRNPIQGILPSGWIEKHTHALPSTLLIVTTLDLSNTPYQQALLEKYLCQSIENISGTCARKRASPVHLVCLVRYANKGIGTPKEISIENERLGSIKSVCRLSNGSVTAMHYFEEEKNTIFVQEDFKKLQKAIEGESMLYYLTQVRRCKRKYSLLHHEKFLDLLPFAARYCTKIAVFYEFQGFADPDRAKKSHKYWAEAYKNVQDYYLHLQRENESGRRSRSRNRSQSVGMTHGGRNLIDLEIDNQVTGTTAISSLVGGCVEDGSGDRESIAITTSISEGDSLKSGHTGQEGMDEFGSELSPPPPSSSGDGVEVALVYSTSTGGGKLAFDPPNTLHQKGKEESVCVSNDGNIITHSEDMMQQCRAVADLLNIKLLLTSYASSLQSFSNLNVRQENLEDITFAQVARQIRTHTQTFLTAPLSLLTNVPSGDCNNLCNTRSWHFLAFAARQHLVISEFLHQNPVRVPPNHASTLDKETAIYCNAFRRYLSCAETFLRLDSAVKKSKNIYQTCDSKTFDHDGNDGRQRFIGCLSNQDLEVAWDQESKCDHQELALVYLQRAIDMLKKKESSQKSDLKTLVKPIARVHYLMAGTFMKRKDYQSAIKHFKLVSSPTNNFASIRIAAEIGIRKCVELCSEDKAIQSSAALLLDCNCNRLLLHQDMATLQMSLSEESPTKVTWPYDAESSQPLHYSFTFPSCSYAVEGDDVAGLLHLYSSFPLPVKIESINLDMNVGSVVFGKTSIIFIRPRETIKLSCILSVPNGCMKDIDPKTLERQTVKKSRRNTFGLTKIGGGVYGKGTDNKQSGGLCVSCLGAEFTLRLPGSDNLLTITLHNQYRGSFSIRGQDVADEVGQKRLSLEEDNFVYSAWSRPDFFSMHSGPRCLRILRAQSELEIIDITSPVVKNKVMIGTVNRFLFLLKSGSVEQCHNLKMRVTCSSWADGGIPTTDATDVGNLRGIDQDVLPLLVRYSPSGNSVDNEKFVLPDWEKVNGTTGTAQNADEWFPIADTLNCASEMFCSFELYKPLPTFQGDIDVQCKTNFTVDISYKQIRLDQDNDGEHLESVLQTYRGIVTWCSPFNTEFEVLSKKEVSTPSGSRHPLNALGNTTKAIGSNVAISGKSVGVSCSLQAKEAANNLAVEVRCVDFETDPNDGDCDIFLIQQGNARSSTLYTPNSDDYCNKLIDGSKMKIAYTVRPKLKHFNEPHPQIISAPLGLVSVSFRPIALSSPEPYQLSRCNGILENYHGPLPIDNLPPLRQKGPPVYIEATPFEASFSTLPSIPRVTSPFEIKYTLKNNTRLQQRIKVSMNESEGTSNGMLISGIVNGEIVLGPMECTVLSYSLLVTKIGKTFLPVLNVSSLRYNSWIIRSSKQDTIYVLP